MSLSRKKISPTSAMHFFKLYFRSTLFFAALILYIINRVRHTGEHFGGYEDKPLFLLFLWAVFVVEMILRFFPAKVESMGCQKQFARNCRPAQTGRSGATTSPASVIAVAVAWIALNASIGVTYFLGWIDKGILLLIALAYSVCDMICILFFCPFQTWFMKNKCCTTCRIYNWDYAMMFTPLVFLQNIFAWSLLGLALALLIQWEIQAHRHPERFSENTNACLDCGACKEKLCSHKRQLRQFLRKNKDRLVLTGNRLLRRENNKKE